MPLSHDQLTTAYEEYHTLIWRFCVARVGDPEVANDIVARVWEQAVRGASQYEDRGFTIKAWLFQIARSRCIDYRRQQQRRTHQTLLEADHSTDMRQADIRLELHTLLKKCTQREQHVLILHYLYGFEHKEIARRFGMTLAATKALRHRAFERLRRG